MLRSSTEPRARRQSHFSVGDLVRSTSDSFLGPDGLVLVTDTNTDSLPACELFFYGVACSDGSAGEEYLWNTENFEVVSKVRSSQKNSIKKSGCL